MKKKKVQNKLIYGSWKEQKHTMKQLHRESLKNCKKRKIYAFGV